MSEILIHNMQSHVSCHKHEKHTVIYRSVVSMVINDQKCLINWLWTHWHSQCCKCSVCWCVASHSMFYAAKCSTSGCCIIVIGFMFSTPFTPPKHAFECVISTFLPSTRNTESANGPFSVWVFLSVLHSSPWVISGNQFTPYADFYLY